MQDYELYHHGILGQKWGVRRFQNKDGTRTDAGKRRERAARNVESMSDEELRSAVNRLQNEQNYRRIMASRKKSNVAENLRGVTNVVRTAGSAVEIANAISGGRLKDAKEIVGGVGKLSDTSGKLADQIGKNYDDSEIKDDLSVMTDADLNRKVNRLLLEDRYNTLRKTANVSRGEHFFKETLPIIAGVTTVVGSAASLGLTILKMTKELD